ncbi:hypothetical protein [Phenylobacterium aquaticum]|uniref:hypothetical protein n=1 Tax=Phenylobacterium aquaticum TaxID=1763816 RepID=UPI0026EDC1AA|nr:hypothetical protein [Phenylobacterium aquaticum]
MAQSRASRLRTYLIVGVAGFFALMLLPMLIPRSPGPPGVGRILVVTGLVALGVGWWAVFAVRIYRTQDEFWRTGERVAWHWGGLLGLLISVPVFVFIGLGGLHWLNPATDAGPLAARAFTSGYMLPVMLQAVGSTLVGLWWRWAKR